MKIKTYRRIQSSFWVNIFILAIAGVMLIVLGIAKSDLYDNYVQWVFMPIVAMTMVVVGLGAYAQFQMENGRVRNR